MRSAVYGDIRFDYVCFSFGYLRYRSSALRQRATE